MRKLNNKILLIAAFVLITGVIGIGVVQAGKNMRECNQMLRGLAEDVAINNRDELVSLLKVYTAYDQKGQIELKRFGREYDGGYLIPIKALTLADAMISYGIRDDNSFEVDFSESFKKPSYGFDCGEYAKLNSESTFFTLIKECIGDDRYLEKNKPQSNLKFNLFGFQVNSLGLVDKKLFVKMDIEGGELDYFDEILENHSSITFH